MIRTSRKTTAIFFVTALLVVTPAQADIFSGLDVGIGSGLVVGRVSATEADGTSRQFRTGGIPFVGMLNRDLASKWTGSLQGQVLLDTVNQQMIRQGFSGSLAYHLFGGVRRMSSVSDIAKNVATNRYNLSVVLRGGIFNFAAAEKNDPEARLSGSIWEMASGTELRYSPSEANAFGASAMTTVVTLPASVDRLSARMIEVLGFWRVYL